MICNDFGCFARDSGLGPIENCDKKCPRRIYDKTMGAQNLKVKHVMAHQKPKDSIENKLNEILYRQERIISKLEYIDSIVTGIAKDPLFAKTRNTKDSTPVWKPDNGTGIEYLKYQPFTTAYNASKPPIGTSGKDA